MKKISFIGLVYVSLASLSLIACNKREAGKGEKEEGVYYNERTDQNGSSDTTANTDQNSGDTSGQHIGNNTDSTTVDGPKGSVSNN